MRYYRDDKFIKAFGDNLKKLRLEKGLSQEKLAWECGFELSQIQRIEYGQVNTSISHASAIATALNIKVTILFDFPIAK